MKKKHNTRALANTTAAPAAGAPSSTAAAQAFSFGDPVPVLDRAEILGYTEAWNNGQWYEPPVSLSGLARSLQAGTHHASALFFKRNILASTFIPHKLLTRQAFTAWCFDFLVFGNSYLERQNNRLGGPLKLVPPLAKYIRRTPDLRRFVQTDGWRQTHEFQEGTIFHLRDADVNQEVYGLPEYLGALHSAWLNESATLFRRRYYENGSHAGFILYMTDPAQREEDVDAIRQALKDSKGPGNFRNLFMYSPQGKKDGIQLIPVWGSKPEPPEILSPQIRTGQECVFHGKVARPGVKRGNGKIAR